MYIMCRWMTLTGYQRDRETLECFMLHITSLTKFRQLFYRKIISNCVGHKCFDNNFYDVYLGVLSSPNIPIDQ